MNTSKNSIKFNLIEEEIEKLETHKYAPELNKVHMCSGKTISTPRCETIPQAINYIINHNLWG